MHENQSFSHGNFKEQLQLAFACVQKNVIELGSVTFDVSELDQEAVANERFVRGHGGEDEG